MFGRKKQSRELDVPPMAKSDPEAVEILRVWASPGNPGQLTLNTCWQDPGAWGLLLADVTRHAAQAYEREGQDPEEVMRRFLELFQAELESPTDEPLDLTDSV